MLFPLDILKPSEILSRYSEWIYFTVLLVFFISIAGITLRKHFTKPYIRPLIIAVGLMLTVGVFMVRERLANIFEGWGMLGTILLVFMAATVPYGLCRGFGMTPGKAFHLTYVLFYILSWTKFPEIYYNLGERNLGLVNLGLLILFFVSLYKIFRFRKSRGLTVHSIKNPFRAKVEQEIDTEDREKKMVLLEAGKMTDLKLHTVNDIASELGEIQKTVEKNRNSLPREARETIVRTLKIISNKETLFKNEITHLKIVFRRLELLDMNQLKELKERLAKLSGKERYVLQAEISREEEKIKLEQTVMGAQSRLERHLQTFNHFLKTAMEKMQVGYPYESLPYLAKARVFLKDLSGMIQDMRDLEKKIIDLIKIEKGLLEFERKTM